MCAERRVAVAQLASSTRASSARVARVATTVYARRVMQRGAGVALERVGQPQQLAMGVCATVLDRLARASALSVARSARARRGRNECNRSRPPTSRSGACERAMCHMRATRRATRASECLHAELKKICAPRAPLARRSLRSSRSRADHPADADPRTHRATANGGVLGCAAGPRARRAEDEQQHKEESDAHGCQLQYPRSARRR